MASYFMMYAVGHTSLKSELVKIWVPSKRITFLDIFGVWTQQKSRNYKSPKTFGDLKIGSEKRPIFRYYVEKNNECYKCYKYWNYQVIVKMSMSNKKFSSFWFDSWNFKWLFGYGCFSTCHCTSNK